MKLAFTSLFVVCLAFLGFSQASITGRLIDASGEPLIGATVQLDGPTSTGTVTDVDGKFAFGNLQRGAYKLTMSYLGYATMTKEVNVTTGITNLGDITMQEDQYALSEVQVVADYVVERRTPVAVATVDKAEIEATLGSRDIPMMMNRTPSVYATEQGGGSGDSRINVRGFDQRNVAIMINGVPVNDMENGWVYWSNWDGIGDATSSVQLQRGLSAVNLATPSIGGTMNIVTSPAEKKAGAVLKAEAGSGGFLKTTITGHTGMISDRFALSASIVRKVGKGLVEKTWTDAWAYYFGTTFKINDKHKLELFALGAPQRHGQNLYKQNIATYSHELAASIPGYDTAAFSKFKEQGRFFNQNWAPVDKNYSAEQFWNGKTHKRKAADYINERENFYNKPLVNLNWYANFSPKAKLYTTLYWSGGKGGGSGTMGKVYRRDADGNLGDDDYKFYYGSSPWSWDWNETIRMNGAPKTDTFYVDKKPQIKTIDKQSMGILRNSRNNQNTIGAITKLKMKWSDKVRSTFGLDWRTATIDHFREIRDLLGGTAFIKTNDEFHPNQQVGLGDKVDYYNTNTVDWLGVFAQTEYSSDDFSVFGMIGLSTIKYSYTNHFAKDPDHPDQEFKLVTDPIKGLQVKGGANYRFIDNVNAFVNLGYVNKVPIFDAVIDDRSGTKATNPKNEKFLAFEGGVNFFSPDNVVQARLSGYYTLWKDRTKRFNVNEQDGGSDLVYVTGMDQQHTGIEFDINVKPIDLVEIGLTASMANWKNVNDVSGEYRSFENNTDTTIRYNFYVKDLYTGDAPQNQFVLSTTFFPVKGLSAEFLYRHYSKFYAKWDPFSRTTLEEDNGQRVQSWKVPNYGVFDTHISYNLPLKGKMGVRLFLHGFNLADLIYISDAVDNSKYNAFMGPNNENSHKASAAEVFLGSPRRFIGGVKLTF